MPFTPNYLAEAAARNMSIGYLIEIEGITKVFTNADVIGIPANDQEPSIVRMEWNPSKLSIDSTNITIGTLSITLQDPNDTLVNLFTGGATILKKRVTLKRGFKNLNISDWSVLSIYEIYEVGSTNNTEIVIKARDRMADVDKPVLVAETYLTSDYSAAPGNGTVNAYKPRPESGFTVSGVIAIESEILNYSFCNSLTFSISDNPRQNAALHKAGTPVYQVHQIQGNPIDLMLKLLISPNGGISGSIYDNLPIGLSIDENTIDVESFEKTRDQSTVVSDTYRFDVLKHIPSLLSFLEKEIFQFCNVRLFVNDQGKIACALLAETIFTQLGGSIDETDIVGQPAVSTSSQRVVNRVKVKYDLDRDTGKYLNESTLDDTDSQAIFGVIEGASYSSGGVRSGFDGVALMERFGRRLFRRVGQPFGLIKDMKALWNKQFFQPGDKVSLTHPDVLDFANGVRGIIGQSVEIISPDYNLDEGTVTYTLNNSPSLTGNFGFVSPSSGVASGTSSTVFAVESGEVARCEWVAGQVIALWPKEGGPKVAEATILSILGDQITLSGAGFGVTPTTAQRIQYADYDTATADQKAFAFASDGANPFPDARTPYVVS